MRPGPRNRVARAVAAAQVVAGRHGVRSAQPTVLHDGVNVVVHLSPAPVVARVATLTPLLRPAIGRPYDREVRLAAALAEAGAAVVPPSRLLPPGPHEHDGLVLSFWTHLPVLPDSPTPAQAAGALAGLHEALAGMPLSGPTLDTPLDDLATFLDRAAAWGISEDQLDRLRERLVRLRPRLGGNRDRQALHGDAHPGNLLGTPAGWVWADLEDSCSGPRAWDLACLRTTRRLDGRAALDAYPGAPSDEQLAPWLALRRLHAAAWAVVFAVGHPTFTPEAHRRLAAALAG